MSIDYAVSLPASTFTAEELRAIAALEADADANETLAGVVLAMGNAIASGRAWRVRVEMELPGIGRPYLTMVDRGPAAPGKGRLVTSANQPRKPRRRK